MQISWAVVARNRISLATIASTLNKISPILAILVRSSLINRSLFLLVLLAGMSIKFCRLIKKKAIVSASQLILLCYLENLVDICYKVKFVYLVLCFCFADYVL